MDDVVQGRVEINNIEVDDFILIRQNNTPTYMLSVVVDDHDLGVNYIIRGDDHLNNYFRQRFIYEFMGWEIPKYAHIPLIHGSDGSKLSKRHGALAVSSYKEMGILPESLQNYLLRLGWSHGDDEIITTPQAINWFDFRQIGKSSARFDLAKLENFIFTYRNNI